MWGTNSHQREYKLSTSLGCTDTKDGGRNRGSTLTTLQSHVPPSCCYVYVEIQLLAPLQAKLTPRRGKAECSFALSYALSFSSALVYLLCCADMVAGEGIVVVMVVMSTLLAPSCSASSYLMDVGQEWKPTSSLSPTDSQTKNSSVLAAPAR